MGILGSWFLSLHASFGLLCLFLLNRVYSLLQPRRKDLGGCEVHNNACLNFSNDSFLALSLVLDLFAQGTLGSDLKNHAFGYRRPFAPEGNQDVLIGSCTTPGSICMNHAERVAFDVV